jgi:signal transduction histidine kinase
LTFTPYADLPAVRGEENQLAQVITNLIGNAINYTQAGEIYISTGSKDAQVLIEVRDTGLGIAPDDLPHLFERFYRGHHTRQIRGTGLGLAIVKEIVDLHDGRIEVESEVGVGTTLRVWLPIAK